MRARALLAAVAAGGVHAQLYSSARIFMDASAPSPDWCLYANEVMLWDATGALISVGTARDGYDAPVPSVTDYSFGGQFNSYPSGQTPYGPTGFTGYASAPCRATDVLTFRFPAPTTVSQIMFFSRADNNVIVTRPVNNSYRVALVNEAGADVEVVSLAEASTVITRNFSTPYAAPALPPPPSDAVQIAQRTTWVRYIRVTSAGLQSLTFKELFVFDAAGRNLLRGRPCYAAGGYYYTYATCNQANNMAIDFDGPNLNADSYLSNLKQAWVEFDLGAVYPVSRIVLFNTWYARCCSVGGGARAVYINNAYLTLRSGSNSTLLNVTLLTAPIINIPVALASASPGPTPSTSPTASLSFGATASASTTATGSPSGSVTPPGTSTSTATPSGSPTTSRTPSGTRSGTVSATGTTTATPSTGASATGTPSAVSAYPQRISVESFGSSCLSFTELLAFDTTGRLVSAQDYNPSAAAYMSANLDESMLPSYGNDLCMGVNETGGPAQGCAYLTGLCGTNVSQSWWVDLGAPMPIGAVYLVNRNAAGAVAGSVNLYRSDGTIIGGYAVSSSLVVTSAQVAPIVPPPPALTVATATEEQMQMLVASVRLRSRNATYLNFREIMLLDPTGLNVALYKPVNGSAQYVSAAHSISLSAGVNGIIDLAAAPLDLVHSAAQDGSGWWSVDLQGLFTIERVIYFNRGDSGCSGVTCQLRSQGVSVTFLNTYGSPIGSLTMSSDVTASYPVRLVQPSPTASVTPPASPSATPPATATASNSYGATPSVTASPLSPHPASLRIATSGVCLNFLEVLVFSTSGALLSRGGVASSSSILSAANTSALAADGCVSTDVTGAPSGGCSAFSTACGGSQWWSLAFGPVSPPLYPNGMPTPVGSVYFINRVDGGFGTRVTTGGGTMTLYRADGSEHSTSPALGSGLVSSWLVSGIVTPAAAVSLETASPAQMLSMVAGVRIDASAANFLNFRELMVIDSSGVNVALYKPVNGSAQYVSPAHVISLESGVNGIIDLAAAPLDLVHSAAQDGSGWWSVDLQGLYTIERLILINRADVATTYAARTAGATLRLLNGFGSPIASITLTAGLTQTYANITYFAPSTSPTLTQTPSTTASPTASPSATASRGATPSLTASPLSLHPASLRIATTGVCLHMLEVLVFSTDGRLISAPPAVASLSVGYNDALYAASNANDLCFSVDSTGLAVGCRVAHTNCTGAQWLNLAFGPVGPPLYPNGMPTPVGSVYFINRVDGGFGTRVTTGGGTMTLYRADGSVHSGPTLLNSGLVSSWLLNNIVTPAAAIPLETASSAQLRSLVASVRVSAAAAGVLNFRELMVLDSDGVNVALGKPVNGSAQSTSTNPLNVMSLESGVNGIVDLAAAPIDVVCSASADGSGWWSVDLQGLYNVSRLIFINRADGGLGSRSAGARVQLLNGEGAVISSTVLTTGLIQVFSPGYVAATRSGTASPSATVSVSLTASASQSPSSGATASGSSSLTASTSASATPSSEPSATRTTTSTPSSTRSGTPAATGTRTTTPTGTGSRSWSSTATASLTLLPSPTTTGTRSNTASGSRSGSETASPSTTASGTRTPTPPATASRTGTPSSSGSRTGTPSSSATATGSVSATSSETASVSSSQTGTPSSSGTQTGTPSSSATVTGTPSSSGTQTGSGSASQTQTRTASASPTGTSASTGTPTSSPASTGTGTSAATTTRTKTTAVLYSPTRSRTATKTRTASRTKTKTKTRTPSKKKKLVL